MATETPKLAAEKAEKQQDFYHLTSSSHFRVCLLLAPPSTLGIPSQKEGLTILTPCLKFQFLSSSPHKAVKCKAQPLSCPRGTENRLRCNSHHPGPLLTHRSWPVGIPYLLSCAKLSTGGIFCLFILSRCLQKEG